MSSHTQTTEEPALITAMQVSQIIGVSKRTVWRMLSAGQLIKPIRIGSNTRWRREELLDWIDAGCPSATTREQ